MKRGQTGWRCGDEKEIRWRARGRLRYEIRIEICGVYGGKQGFVRTRGT